MEAVTTKTLHLFAGRHNSELADAVAQLRSIHKLRDKTKR